MLQSAKSIGLSDIIGQTASTRSVADRKLADIRTVTNRLRILALNALALLILTGGVIGVQSSGRGLVEERLNSIQEQADIVTARCGPTSDQHTLGLRAGDALHIHSLPLERPGGLAVQSDVTRLMTFASTTMPG